MPRLVNPCGRRNSFNANMNPKLPIISAFFGLLSPLAPHGVVEGAEDGGSDHIDLRVARVVEPYPPYADFCRRQPKECQLSGAGSLSYSDELINRLEAVTAEVNGEVKFALDSEIHAVEDFWTLPTSGYGDCEDSALAKRSRLVKFGYSAGALRLAFVFHKEDMTAHCVLTVETTRGTFLLDSQTDEVKRWSEVPYNFEARERRDGRWDRYDQSQWQYDSPVSTTQ